MYTSPRIRTRSGSSFRSTHLYALLPLLTVLFFGLLVLTIRVHSADAFSPAVAPAVAGSTGVEGQAAVASSAVAPDAVALGGLQLFIPLAVPILIALLKLWLPRIPSHYLPWVAPILGAALDIAQSYATGHGAGTGIAGALLGSAGVGLREIVDQTRRRVEQIQAAAQSIAGVIVIGSLLLLGIGLSGCAQFSTTQTDKTWNDNGDPDREITTRASAMTFFASKTALAKWQASQTDKQQRASVGSLEQSSDASTILNGVVSNVVAAAISAAKK